MIEFSMKKITKQQSQDTGMAIVLLVLLIDLKLKQQGVLIIAMSFHVLNILFPMIYKPAAVVWLGFSHLLSMVTSKILLSVLFFGVVTPIGLLRRLFGKDSLRLHAFKVSQDTVMLKRNHQFSSQDIERPY